MVARSTQSPGQMAIMQSSCLLYDRYLRRPGEPVDIQTVRRSLPRPLNIAPFNWALELQLATGRTPGVFRSRTTYVPKA